MAAITQSLSRPSFSSNLRALYIIAKMDWKRYWRYPLNALGSVFQPLIWLSPIYFMGMAFSVNGQAKGFAGYAGTTDYISFVIIGSILGNFISTVFWGMGYALKSDMDSGVLETNWLMPIPRPLLLIGRTFSSLVIQIIMSAGMLLTAGLIFGFHASGSALQALIPAVPMLVGLYGFGIAFSAIVLLMRDANAMVDMSSYLVSLFSGQQFPVQALPRVFQPISLAIPMTYGFDAVRGLLLKTKTFLPIPYEVALLVATMLALIAFGVVVFARMERQVRIKGTLGQH